MALERSRMLRTAPAHWTRKTEEGPPQGPTSWWEHPLIVSHVNKSICGAPIEGLGAGDVSLLERRLPDRVVERAISIGCGAGGKE
jgi:hypothetical protein